MKFDSIYNEYERYGRISQQSIEGLKSAILGNDPYSAITAAGDCAAFDTGPELNTVLTSDDPMVRWNAAGVLFTRFRNATYADRCLKLATDDPDEMVRSIALCGLGEILDRISDPELRLLASKTLLDTFQDEGELHELRQSAYEGILAAISIPPEDRPSAARSIDLTTETVLNLVQKYREKYLSCE